MSGHLYKNTAILSLTLVLSRLLSFIFSILIARYLGAELFGKFIYVYTFIILFSFVVDFGLSSLVVRDIAKDRSKTNSSLSNSFLIRIIFSFIVYGGILLYALTKSHLDFDIKYLLIIMGVFLFVRSFFEISLNFFQAYEMQNIFGWLQLTYSAIVAGAAVLLILFRCKLYIFGFIFNLAGSS